MSQDKRLNRTQEVVGSSPGQLHQNHEIRDIRFNSSPHPSATTICRDVVLS